jgi:hypothetical protein
MSAFLEPAELERLTGSAQKSLQVEWLRSRRIRHYVNRRGEPVVAWRWLDGTAEVAALRKRPNFGSLPKPA